MDEQDFQEIYEKSNIQNLTETKFEDVIGTSTSIKSSRYSDNNTYNQPIHIMSDEEIMRISNDLIFKNKKAYKELAK